MAKFFLLNPGFELGDRDWAKETGWAIAKDVPTSRTGSWRAAFTGSSVASLKNISFPVRPGHKLSASAWIDGSVATAATLKVAITYRDKDLVSFVEAVGSGIAFGGGGYAQSTLVDTVVPNRAKFAFIKITMSGTPNGSTWYADDLDLSGDFIETIPATATESIDPSLPCNRQQRALSN